MWNPEETSPNFQEALYGESSDEDEGEDDNIIEISEEEEFEDTRDGDDLMPSPYSSISRRGSPEPYRDGGRDRSRSPTRGRDVPVRVLDSREVVDVVYGEDFYAADSHALYVTVEVENVENDPFNASSDLVERGNSRERSLRGRGRRGERARGRRQQNRGRGQGRSRNASRWQPGQPLQEVWLTDQDVPPELREMVRDVLRRRQARAEETEARRIARRVNESVRVEDESESENDDAFQDASEGRGNTILEGVDFHFEWLPMETFRGVEETFIPERTGSVSSYNSPYDAFRSYWDDGILQTIVDETNRYASRIQSAAFQSEWYPTNAHELLCLFAFWMMTGIIRMPTIGSYFQVTAC